MRRGKNDADPPLLVPDAEVQPPVHLRVGGIGKRRGTADWCKPSPKPRCWSKSLRELEDCGDGGHLWETLREKRDPTNSDNVLLAQRRRCVFCDGKERVIAIYHPGPTVESSRLSH